MKKLRLLFVLLCKSLHCEKGNNRARNNKFVTILVLLRSISSSPAIVDKDRLNLSHLVKRMKALIRHIRAGSHKDVHFEIAKDWSKYIHIPYLMQVRVNKNSPNRKELRDRRHLIATA